MPTPIPPTPSDVVQAAVVASPPAKATLTPVDQNVHQAVKQLHSLNSDKYAASLVTLRQSAADAAPAIKHTYAALPAESYVERWSLVKVLADMNHPATLKPLENIATAPLPAAQGGDATHVLAEETIIRTTAAEGIAQLAATGQADALAALLQNCQSPVFSVKQVSVQAYLAAGGPTARATLERLLPPAQHFVLDIRAVGAADLPAIAVTTPAAKTARAIALPAITGAAATSAPVADAPTHQ